jgi:hypothetical protein
MYFITADIPAIQTVMEKCLILFKSDAEEICKEKGIVYPESVARQVISYFNKNVIS